VGNILQFPTTWSLAPLPRDVALCPRTFALIAPGVAFPGVRHVFSFTEPKKCALCGLQTA